MNKEIINMHYLLVEALPYVEDASEDIIYKESGRSKIKNLASRMRKSINNTCHHTNVGNPSCKICHVDEKM